jgi:hypothetical protein
MNLFISMYSKSRLLCGFCRRIVKAQKVDRALRNVFCMSKDWLLRNQDIVSEWSDMYIRGLLFPLANTIKIN